MRGCEHCEVGCECEREYVRKCECVGGGRVSECEGMCEGGVRERRCVRSVCVKEHEGV